MTQPVTLMLYNIDLFSELCSIAGSTITVQYNDDLQTCIDSVTAFQPNDIVFLILTAADALEILPKINHLRQLDSIFILGKDDNNRLEQYSKIIDYFEQKSFHALLISLERNIDLSRKQAESFKFYNQHQKSTRELSEEKGSFLWLQLFKYIVLQLPHDEEAKQEMVEKLQESYHNNNKQLKAIQKFSETYKVSEPLRWYTGQPFIYKQINRALRTEDIELLYKFRYFISDVCRSIEEKYADLKEFVDTVKVYRGVQMSTAETDRLKQNVGKLISTNGFLSTSLLEDVASRFLGANDSTGDQRSVLFKIDCDMNAIEHARLASLREFSENFEEEEILFDLDTVFEIVSIETDAKNLIHVQMKVTDEGRRNAQDYIDNVKRDIAGSSTARIIFGRLLADMGLYDKCETYFQQLISKRDSHSQKEDEAFLYYYLAGAKNYKNHYDEALKIYQIAYDLLMEANPPRLMPSSYVLNEMGSVCMSKGQPIQAMKYHQRAMKIREELSDYRGLATSLESIGIIQRQQGDYDSALESFTKCFTVRKKIFPEEHQQIASCLLKIANVYKEQDKLDSALNFAKQALKINEECLPSGHPNIGDCLQRIGQILYFGGRNDEALKYYKHALTIRENVFSTMQGGDHPNIAK